MNIEEFSQKCNECNIEITSFMQEKFLIYADLLREWNEKINLTAITEPEEIIEKHFYDSLLPLTEIEIQGTLCDVGSGAGFPSIPMKIVRPDLQVTILEPLGKRCVFLREVIKVLGLEGIEVVNERAEDYANINREIFDVVTARAVANLPVLAELCIPLVKVDGIFIAMKGAQGYVEDEAATKAIHTLGAKRVKDVEVHLSNEAARVILFYKKEKSTPKNYPRPYAKIKKNPL